MIDDALDAMIAEMELAANEESADRARSGGQDPHVGPLFSWDDSRKYRNRIHEGARKRLGIDRDGRKRKRDAFDKRPWLERCEELEAEGHNLL